MENLSLPRHCGLSNQIYTSLYSELWNMSNVELKEYLKTFIWNKKAAAQFSMCRKQ